MGMDVYGDSPLSKDGEYFRNSCWWWRPLWDYVCNVAKLDDAAHEAGQYNDGFLVDAPTALLIAVILDNEITSGNTQEFEKEYTDKMNAIPEEECRLCHGSGRRTDMVVANGCNGCHGKGKRPPSSTYYPFSTENVMEFAKFVRNSGGFRIS